MCCDEALLLVLLLLLLLLEGLSEDLWLALVPEALWGDSAAADDAMLCSLVVDNESMAESMLI